MPTLEINDGGLAVKDPADILSYRFDWDRLNLDDGVTISNSIFTITQVSGSTSTPLVTDNEVILTGSRRTQIRIGGGTVGAKYKVDNKIVTNENPPQTKERSFKLKIEQK